MWLWMVFMLMNVLMALGIFVLFLRGLAGNFDGLRTPVAFLIATGGFLGIIRAIQVSAVSIVDAIQSSPDATAEALRRGVKAKGP